MNRYNKPRDENEPRYIVFLKRVTVIGTAATVVIGFFNSYLLKPIEALWHHIFRSGGGMPR